MSERESDTNSNEAEIPLWVALAAALAVLPVVRIYPFGSVLRGSGVALLSNEL